MGDSDTTQAPYCAFAAPSAPSLCRMSSVLCYGSLLGLLSGSLMSIVVPTEMGIFQPQFAAKANGVLIAVGCVFTLLAPYFGFLSDGFGSRRPLIIVGALTICGSLAGMIISVTGVLSSHRSTASFVLYCISYVASVVGQIMLNVSFSGVVADYGNLLPEKLGTISSLWSLFQLVGAALGYISAGLLFPVSKDGIYSPNFYYFLTGLVIIANIGLCYLPRELLALPKQEQEQEPETELAHDMIENNININDGNSGVSSIEIAVATTASSKCTCTSDPRFTRLVAILSGWFCSSEYSAYRMVCLSRLIFFFGLGVFATMTLFFFEDQTDAGNDAAQMYSYIALISLVASVLAVIPAGKLCDRYGVGLVAAVGGVVMASVLAIMPFFSSTTIIMIIVPFYGLAQQFYNVGDLGLVVESVPHDSTRARDMGAWSAGQSIGTAIGSAFAGFAISFFHEESSTTSGPFPLAPSSSSESTMTRIPYSKLGYQVVFLAAATTMILSSLIIGIAVRRLNRANDATEVNMKSMTDVPSFPVNESV